MNGSSSTLHRAKAPPASDPLGDFLNDRPNGRTIQQRQRPPPASAITNPTFQKVLLLLIAVVVFDAHYVYKFFSNSDGNSGGHASSEVGVVNMKSNRMDGLANHVIAKLKSEGHVGHYDAGGSERGLAGNSSVRKKVEPSWKSDKRLNPEAAHKKVEPSWKSDKRLNPDLSRENYNQHADESNHLGLSDQRFDSLEPNEKLEELQLEVQLWKGRYEMTVKKLHRLEDQFTQNGRAIESANDKKVGPHPPAQPLPEEVNNLIYEGMDVEHVNASPQDDGNELYDPYKTDVFDKTPETYGIDEHILKILHAAGVEIDEELASILPTWEDVVSMYGPSPIISGLETCDAYKEQVRPEDRMIGPAGMFNTGTNLLYELLKVNCEIKEAKKKPRREPKHNGMRWQAPWGKHNPPSTHRNKNVAKAWGKGIKQTDFMPVVLIKDPYTWMGSQCRHKYSSFWGHDENHCPNLIRWKVTDRAVPSEVVVKFALEMKHYESLLDMWNSWYAEWEQMSFPHLVTRFEDLLFHGEEVVRTACECVGGVFTDDFQYVEDSAKPNVIKVHKGSNGLVSAMVQYGDPAKRLVGFTERDVVYADHAMNKALMEKYGYIPPPPLLSQQQQEEEEVEE